MSVENDWEPDMSVPFPGSPDDMMNTIATLRARVAKLETALKKLDTLLAQAADPAEPELNIGHMQNIVAAALKDTPE